MRIPPLYRPHDPRPRLGVEALPVALLAGRGRRRHVHQQEAPCGSIIARTCLRTAS
jgi:hypothetical protein